MAESSSPIQTWKELRDLIKAADRAASAASNGDSKVQERPFLVAEGAGNPYPATPGMRINGGWDGPITEPHRVREREVGGT
ncbi:hypothetical protein MY4038_010008 [Beauveria bassiana]|uniref:Uncharacterized protein n=2 Tax=Beauveria bassiana TaxID=176275 RepID=A0A2N6NHT1_BEABA|nr:hypothetical protein BM221_007834 [Beauveria bassiana]